MCMHLMQKRFAYMSCAHVNHKHNCLDTPMMCVGVYTYVCIYVCVQREIILKILKVRTFF